MSDGKELMKFDNHSDWVFGTTYLVDGKRMLSGSRDKAMKLINVANGQFIDDINKLLDGVLCIARHPKEDQIAYGGESGSVRIYKIAENQGRTAANNDVNLIKEYERLSGPAYATAVGLLLWAEQHASVGRPAVSNGFRLPSAAGIMGRWLKSFVPGY